MIRNALLTLLLVTPLFAQTRQLDLPSTSGWVDTGVDLNAGDTVKITATGQLQYSNAKQPNGPEGLPRGFADLVRVLQLNDSGRGALIGRVGSTEADRPFLIGASSNTQARVAGRLFVTINQSSFDHATGSYHVTIDRTAAPATTAGGRSAAMALLMSSGSTFTSRSPSTICSASPADSTDSEIWRPAFSVTA